PGHPPGLDHPLPALRRGAADHGRYGRLRPPLRRPGVHRRHPLRPRPGAERGM
ncbi:MAG: O-acetylhomoserine sulfhydrylase / O-succinylhomoserine sulfhydrylase, partial [uncultured Rubrobacteraceae bacterium]